MPDAAQEVTERNVIDASTIIMQTGVAIPKSVKESKYPWAELVMHRVREPEGLHNFYVPIGTREEAQGARTSIHASGKNYLDSRSLPLKPVVRVMSLDGETYGVGAWVVPATSAEDETEE